MTSDDWPGTTFSALYDQVVDLRRRVIDADRGYRQLAGRSNVAVDALGDTISVGECLAEVTAALDQLNTALVGAEAAWHRANQYASRLYQDDTLT